MLLRVNGDHLRMDKSSSNHITISAMGLDDDIEEDYYNPLYDNLYHVHGLHHHHSDSENENEDMYYYFRNNNYHPPRYDHYAYDKDSGFSSGHLM